ncbi:MAG: hypothetical protein MUE50_09070, partial [Pirellulaceae bacterium]|nr:hypothetical protein [Pirellulaceae bacterium]
MPSPGFTLIWQLAAESRGGAANWCGSPGCAEKGRNRMRIALFMIGAVLTIAGLRNATAADPGRAG